MNLVEQIGRYASMFLMVFNIGLAEVGFSSVGAFIVYMLGNILLMISYWTIWVLYFKKKAYWKQIALALIPTCIFLLSGITMLHFLLIIFAVIFGIGHLYVTNKNRVDLFKFIFIKRKVIYDHNYYRCNAFRKNVLRAKTNGKNEYTLYFSGSY